MADDIKHFARRLRPRGRPPSGAGVLVAPRLFLARLATACTASLASLLHACRLLANPAFPRPAVTPVPLLAGPILRLARAELRRVAPRTVCRKR